MKKFANILFLAVLFVLPSVVQSDFSAIQYVEFEIVQPVQNHKESNVPQDGIYDPFLPFKVESGFSFFTKVPKIDVNEKLHDQFSRETITRVSYPNNNASFITSTRQIEVGLSIRKLVFPFHSFL